MLLTDFRHSDIRESVRPRQPRHRLIPNLLVKLLASDFHQGLRRGLASPWQHALARRSRQPNLRRLVSLQMTCTRETADSVWALGGTRAKCAPMKAIRAQERLNLENDGDSCRPSSDLCYNLSMLTFGKGPVLKDACPCLQHDAERHRRILEVTERDSVIEGLPPFHDETRRPIAE